MRLPRAAWLAVALAFAAGITLGLSLQLGLVLRGEPGSPQLSGHPDLLSGRSEPFRGLRKAKVSSVRLERIVEEVPSYVVEEHHEALVYWRAAASAAGTRQKPHVLLHFDAHPDFAIPSSQDGDKLGLSSNDEFIAAAGLQGLVDRFIWIWPAWDGHGRRHKKHGDVRIVVMALGRTTETSKNPGLPCACEEKFDVKASELADPLGWQRYFAHTISDKSTKCDVSDDDVDVDLEDCSREKRFLQVDVNEQSLLSTQPWWPSLLDGPLILDIDEDHFGQKVAEGRVLDIRRRLKDPLEELVCLLHVNEDHVNHLLRTLVVGHMENSRGPAPEELIALCSGELIEPVRTVLRRLSRLELELLLLYGFCFSTSPRSVQTHVGERYLRVCDAGAEMVASDTDRSDAEEALAEEPVAISKRLDLFAASLRSLKPWAEKAELTTVCRSMRDGYTPNRVWHQIETGLLAMLGPNVTFDENLVGGPNGWEAWTQDAETMMLQVVPPAREVVTDQR